MKVIKSLNGEPVPIPQVRKELDEAYEIDTKFENSRVLYSMCNSPPQIAREAHLKFIEANLGDSPLYPGTLILEKSVISMIGGLLHAPDTMAGSILNGGSEANILSLWIAREKRNTSKELEVVVPESAHYSIEVACKMLRLKMRPIPLDENYVMDFKAAKENIKENTCAVVGIAGTTELGVIDPIPQLSKLCEERGIHLHVDAAFGGFVFPFLELAGWEGKFPLFDFRLMGVRSITVDPHKMGRSTQPAGALLVREQSDLQYIKFNSYYLSSSVQHTMLGTRCSASVASAYAVMRSMGKNGYINMLQGCMKRTNYLCRLLKEEKFQPAIEEPIAPIVVIKFPQEYVEAIRKTLQESPYDWRVSVCRHPPGIRVVLMPHVRDDILPSFVNDLKLVCEKLKIR